MNYYLVYLHSDGKNKDFAHGDSEKLSNPTNAVWNCYTKFWYPNRWEDYRMKIGGWEYPILREIKGNLVFDKVSSFTY